MKENSKQTAKQTAKTILAIFLLATTSFLICFPLANSATWQATYCFINVAPSPIGIGQQAQVTFWLSATPPLNGNYETVFHGFTIVVTKPDGQNSTMGPFNSDTVGSGYTLFTPDQLGNYSFQCFYAGENTTATAGYYNPSMSKSVSLTVQEEQIQHYPFAPLPTAYWARPINAENRMWYPIAGNWLFSGYDHDFTGAGFFGNGGAVDLYTSAPESSHILWTKQQEFGGLVDSKYGSIDYYTGLTYEGRWIPPIIMNGRLYYSTLVGASSSFQGTECVDLTTGKEIWWQNITVSRGQLYDYESPNQHGIIPYLWDTSGTTWYLYDPFNGQKICEFTNVTTGGRFATSTSGDLLYYVLDSTHRSMYMWNSSWNPALLAGTTGTNAWQWRPTLGRSYNWTAGIQWNASIATGLTPGSITSMDGFNEGKILASSGTTDICYDATTGAFLWNQTRTPPDGNQTLSAPGGNIPYPVGDGIYCRFTKETMQWHAYSLSTGKELWVTDPYTNDWAVYPAGGVIAYGHLYTAGYDGIIRCHDNATGKILWQFQSFKTELEAPYGNYPFFGGITVADGKIYIATNEHSPNSPPILGERIYCINATDGKYMWSEVGLWNGPGGGRGCGLGPGIVADGIYVSLNGDDNQLYGFGKGPTETTVTASPKITTQGNSVLIQGTVTDQSPGQTCLGIPQAGTPAISEQSMEQWMAYLFMQKPMPTNATGVPVSLYAIDANGNYRDIGNTTSDAAGTYCLEWKPDIPGQYKVIATFAGSTSYWSSSAETYFAIDQAPQATNTIAPAETLSLADQYFVPAIAGTILAFVIIAIALALIVRKRA